MTETANSFLVKNLNKDMVVLEFGSGRSTQFFANRVKQVLSREHNEEWFDIVTKQIANIANIKYEFYDDLGKYADVTSIENNTLDVVIVDGRNRINCLLNSVPKLKSGGILVLDNAERYLAYETSSPGKHLLNSRNPKWIEAEKILKEIFWRYNTTNGVFDTLIFFKR
jgi:predicted O-methyltransferase YrrM